jgi:hypothetical protein
MSVEAISWASKQKTGSPGAKLVLIALANYANDLGQCWPSQATMAMWTEQSERTIRAHLATLEAMGLIGRQHRTEAGAFTSDLVTLNIGQRQNLPAAKSADGEKQQPPAANFAAYPSKEPSYKKRPIERAREMMPDVFKPNDTHRRLAAELRLDLARELTSFCDHHKSHGSAFKDWDAAFRTWLRRAREFKDSSKPSASRKAPKPDNFNNSSYGESGLL